MSNGNKLRLTALQTNTLLDKHTTWQTHYLTNTLLDKHTTWQTHYLTNTLLDKHTTWQTHYLTNTLLDKHTTCCTSCRLNVLELISVCNVVRSCVLGETAETDNQSMSSHRLRAYATVMSIASSRSSKVSALGIKIMKYLPSPLRNAVDKWNSNAGNEFPGAGAWVCSFCPCSL